MGNHEATLLLEQSEPLRKPRQFGPRSPPRPQVPSTAKKSKRKKKKKSSTESEDSPVSSSEDAEPSPRNLISKELEDELEKYENLVQDLKAQAGGASTEDLAEDVDLIMVRKSLPASSHLASLSLAVALTSSCSWRRGGRRMKRRKDVSTP
eukprot:scaffold2808_cov255-Pinguiococcus_pyrenoidosus.AAC.3